MNADGTLLAQAGVMAWWLVIVGFGLGWVGQVWHNERRKHR